MFSSLLISTYSSQALFLLAQTDSSTKNWIYYIASAVLSIFVLLGISMMSKVQTAVKGNLIGATSMALAIALTLWYFGIFSVVELWIAMIIGAGIGLWLSKKVEMIQMPQMVGLLNGFGGLASMIAGILTIVLNKGQANAFSLFTAGLAIVVGGLTWSGSAVAAAKLHRLMNQRPIVLKNHMLWTRLLLIGSLICVPLFTFSPFNKTGISRSILLILAVVLSNAFGYIFAIRVGGADMPITISLLNSCSGVAGSIAGMALSDLLLVSVGGIVGASGLLLTNIMCRSMNRKLTDILFAKASKPSSKTAEKAPVAGITSAASKIKDEAFELGETIEEKLESAGNKISEKIEDAKEKIGEKIDQIKSSSAANKGTKPRPGRWLADAKDVIIVPGYGMALGHAQNKVKQIADALESNGKKVRFAIHPVAGRMPGHMNVLLAEVNVPYDKLFEMDEINDDFKNADVALVIGANDVVNPAANTAEGTPIYGMPVLDVAAAKHVIICNLDEKPGYAGVDNPLYAEAKEETDHVIFEQGDAKESLDNLLTRMNKVLAGQNESDDDIDDIDDIDDVKDKIYKPGRWLSDAKDVIIVPGYGMALGHAQNKVKQIADALKSEGKDVRFAIHPVAGRMPGHMNVLLAEVDVPYDKLFEMDEINDDFKNADVALVIGANDVVNPAANTAEGTPIYGMPVLDVAAAKHVIICNLDDKPGYAGVDNPLYAEAAENSDHVAFEQGDAKESIDKLQDAMCEHLNSNSENGSFKEDDNVKEDDSVKDQGLKDDDSKASTNMGEEPYDLDPLDNASSFLKKAKKVIIVPGYGMALGHAQPEVKQLCDKLESMDANVEFAIHPVAGRMPGHMNVLLAEVNVPYEKLHEMDEINEDFANTDVAVIIGANDVVNPAANTAEGTPIYGMPILNVADAAHVIILNLDLKPGYAGVDNPLYSENDRSKVTLLLGNAKENIPELIRKLD